MLFLENGRILDPYTGMNSPSNLLIGDDGVIREIGKRLGCPAGCPRLDAAGLTISPGFVDTHAHFRDPGQTDREDLESGAAAAAAGGYTTVVCMANTEPACDNVGVLRDILDRVAALPIRVLQTCAVTRGRRGGTLTDFEALLAAGAAGFTDDGACLTDAALCTEAMTRAADCGALLSLHEEDPALVPSPGLSFGSAAAQRFGVPGAKPEAEETMVARDIALARRTGARVLLQHISSALSVDLIRAGKQLGARIYAEVTPHHLALTEDAALTCGTLARVNPPLRRETDRLALIEGLQDGTLDGIATDHAPHRADEKAQPMAQAPSGMIGLETAFSVCCTALVQTGLLSPMGLIERMSLHPARLYGLEGRAAAVGNRAELVLLDWNAEIVYRTFRSKASNSPFRDKPLRGAVRATVVGDRVL